MSYIIMFTVVLAVTPTNYKLHKNGHNLIIVCNVMQQKGMSHLVSEQGRILKTWDRKDGYTQACGWQYLHRI